MPYVEFKELPEYAPGERNAEGGPVNVAVGPPKWFGKSPPPAIGARVKANFNNLGAGIVQGYFAEANYLGLIVALEDPPEWRLKQNNGANPPADLFGPEIEEI